MLSRALCRLVVLVGLGPAIAVGEGTGPSLCERLPTDKTVVFAQIDVRDMLKQADSALAFIDPDTREKVGYQLKELHGLMKEVAATYEFRPKLLDDIINAEVSFALMLKDEPLEIVHKRKVPKYDEQSMQEIPGEFEEHTWTERKAFTPSLIVQTAGLEVATDFMEEFKALLDRQGEGWQVIEVERGELIGDVDEHGTLGRLDDLLVLSDGDPKELWAALIASPEERVSNTPIYRRLMEVPQKPQAFLVVNLQTLFGELENWLKRSLDEAEKEYAQHEGQPDDQEDWEDGPRQWELQQARTSYKTFLTFKDIFSLDQWEHVGASLAYDITKHRALSEGRLVFSHGEQISPALLELLEGSGSFMLPRMGERPGICVMARLSLKRVYDEVISTLRASDPAATASYDMAMQAMKMMVGLNVEELLAMLASDFYLFVDFVVKEREVITDVEFDEETGEQKVIREKQVGPVPEVQLLWGLNDPQASRDTLNRAFATLSTNPQFNPFIKKRAFQETDVLCLGTDAAKPENYPDGLTSFAVVIVDRYLTVGSWKYATTIIRRMKSEMGRADPEIQRIVEKHKDCNFLMVFPKAAQQRLQEMARHAQADDGDLFDQLLKDLESADFDLRDAELAGRVKSALRELIVSFRQLQEKSGALAPQTSVITGRHTGRFYEIRAGSEVTR